MEEEQDTGCCRRYKKEMNINEVQNKGNSNQDFNFETIEAMEEYFEMKKNPDKYKRYETFKETLDDVLNEK